MIAEPETDEIEAIEYSLAPKQVTNRLRRAKITIEDATAIAKLSTQFYLTETEACHRLKISVNQWFDWKDRAKHKTEYQALFQTHKQAVIVNHVQNIHNVSQGIGVKQRDWRASQFLLQVVDRERFGTGPTQPAQVNNVTLNVTMADALKRVFSQPEQVKVITDVQAVKALPEPS